MKVSFRGGKIHFSDQGEGKVIVLIHGYLETGAVWERFSNRLSHRFRVLCIDLPGHGLSSVCSEVNTMELFAEAIKTVLDHLSIRKIFLTGHSMGGYATLAFLQMFPEYLYGYSLFHSHPFADTPEAVQRRKENIAIVENGEKERMIPGFIRNLFAPANTEKLEKEIEISVSVASGVKEITIIADLKGMMERPDRVSLIEKSNVPFLWILGKMDSHINCETIRRNVRLPQGSSVVILNNSGHMGFVEEEELSALTVAGFIEGIPG